MTPPTFFSFLFFRGGGGVGDISFVNPFLQLSSHDGFTGSCISSFCLYDRSQVPLKQTFFLYASCTNLDLLRMLAFMSRHSSLDV